MTADESVAMLNVSESSSSSGVRLLRARQFLHSKVGMAGASILLLWIVVAIFAPLIAPDNPVAVVPNSILQAPSLHHLFGTDDLGSDVFSRVVFGARYSLVAGLMIVLIGAVVGISVGVIAGYVGGWVDEVLMRVTDVFLAFPSLILAMAVAAVLGPNIVNSVIAISVVWWPWYARLARGQTLRIREQQFVSAAVVSGAKTPHILVVHIMRNVWSPVVVQISLDVGFAILTLAGLSFIGLGAQPPTPEWGVMIATGRNYYLNQWWVITFPGIALFSVVSGLLLLADGLQSVMPSSKGMA